MIDKAAYFTKVIQYIHANPVHHGFSQAMTNWKYTSYHAILSDRPTLVKRQAILDFFGSVEWYRFYHTLPIQLKKHRYCIDGEDL